jgi:hypothetical protein
LFSPGATSHTGRISPPLPGHGTKLKLYGSLALRVHFNLSTGVLKSKAPVGVFIRFKSAETRPDQQQRETPEYLRCSESR